MDRFSRVITHNLYSSYEVKGYFRYTHTIIRCILLYDAIFFTLKLMNLLVSSEQIAGIYFIGYFGEAGVGAVGDYDVTC